MDQHNINTAVQLSDIGMMLEKMGDYDCALEQYQECLAIQEDVLGEDHIDCGSTLYQIGCLMVRMGDLDKACVELQKCYAVRKRNYGRKHPITEEVLQVIESVMQLAITERERDLMHRVNYERLGYGHQSRAMADMSMSNYGGGSSRRHGMGMSSYSRRQRISYNPAA